MGRMVSGRLLIESLRVGAELSVPEVTLRKLGREDVSSSAAASQPEVWGYLDFEAPDERATELADALAGALLREGGWYASFEVGHELVVVFAGRVFRYARGDRVAHRQAVKYARDVGVADHQIDWANRSTTEAGRWSWPIARSDVSPLRGPPRRRFRLACPTACATGLKLRGRRLQVSQGVDPVASSGEVL